MPGETGDLSDSLESDQFEDEEIEDMSEEFVDDEEENMDQTFENEDGVTAKPETNISQKIYLPGDPLEKDAILEYDSTAYDMYHNMNVEWPCLSFAFLRDNLGIERRNFPMTMYMVAGSQASGFMDNKLYIMKLYNLHKTKHDDEDEDEENSDDDDEIDDDPTLEYVAIRHRGGVNRLKVMPDRERQIVASWSEDGHVYINDATSAVATLDSLGGARNRTSDIQPLFDFGGHPVEGFAMDWSPLVSGRLLTGDCKKYIHLWNRTEGASWDVEKVPYSGHTASVEDLQWSPNEQELFASCSIDQTVRLWDARKKEKEAAMIHAHEADVNVISWCRNTSYLLISGCDDGSFKVWDIRNFKSDCPAAQFKWHSGPITSIEWHPSDDSVLAVAGADNQVSLWDLSLEPDTEVQDAPEEPNVPPQLLFVHLGQNDIKEVHWHPQIPGVLASTALTGINVFKTISV